MKSNIKFQSSFFLFIAREAFKWKWTGAAGSLHDDDRAFRKELALAFYFWLITMRNCLKSALWFWVIPEKHFFALCRHELVAQNRLSSHANVLLSESDK